MGSIFDTWYIHSKVGGQVVFFMKYDTPEFHALAAEIANYLKRKKIKDVVDLSNSWIERDMMWYAYLPQISFFSGAFLMEAMKSLNCSRVGVIIIFVFVRLSIFK